MWGWCRERKIKESEVWGGKQKVIPENSQSESRRTTRLRPIFLELWKSISLSIRHFLGRANSACAGMVRLGAGAKSVIPKSCDYASRDIYSHRRGKEQCGEQISMERHVGVTASATRSLRPAFARIRLSRSTRKSRLKKRGRIKLLFDNLAVRYASATDTGDWHNR